MVQNVEELRAELEIKALCHLKVRENSGGSPSTKNLFQESRPIIAPFLALSKRQFIHHVGDDYVPVVKVRTGAVEAEIVDVSRRAAVGGGETSTGGCSHRINRHIVN